MSMENENGKITPFLMSFIVDQYLCDNNFTTTRYVFRNEASSLFAISSIDEVLKTMSSLSLRVILEEYICLKKQKEMLDQQRIAVMQEKNRVGMLLQGVQNSIHAYNTFPMPPSTNVTIMNTNSVLFPPPNLCNKTPPGSQPVSFNTNMETRSFSTSMSNLFDQKSKETQAMNVPTVKKRPRGRPPIKKIPIQGQNIMPSTSNIGVNDVVSQSVFPTQSLDENCGLEGSQFKGFSTFDNPRPSKRVMVTPDFAQSSSWDISFANMASTSESGIEIAIPDIDDIDFVGCDLLFNEMPSELENSSEDIGFPTFQP